MKPIKVFAGLAALTLALFACGTAGDESGADQADQDGAEKPVDDQQETADGALDLGTLIADVDEGRLHAESLQTAFVGELGDDLFIGVAVEDGPDGEPREVVVYLCDDLMIGEWLTGEVDDSGSATLTSTDTMIDYSGDGELRVDLEIGDDEVRGSVSFGQSFDQSFTAEPAGDGAGLFRAEETFEGNPHQAGWIILNDGRRVGTHCFWARNPMTGQKICGCKKVK